MKDIVIGIDAGTSLIKSVAFSLDGEQLAVSSVKNVFVSRDDGAAEQDLNLTWSNTLETLSGLSKQINDLPQRLAAIAVTGQGDGTWLIDKQGQPVCPAWLWLDARASDVVSELSDRAEDLTRFNLTGTGLNACQQGAQLQWLKRHNPSILDNSETAFHCKDVRVAMRMTYCIA